jgi:hypothetical protein
MLGSDAVGAKIMDSNKKQSIRLLHRDDDGGCDHDDTGDKGNCKQL